MKYRVLFAAAATTLLAGCVYEGTGSALVSVSLLQRMLPGEGPVVQTPVAAEENPVADREMNHFIYWMPAGTITRKAQAERYIYTALLRAKRTTDHELCGTVTPLREHILEEVGPVLTSNSQGKGWYFRLTWHPDERPMCDAVGADEYYRAVSRHLPRDAFIYQAAVGGGGPRIYRQGDQVDDVLNLLELMFKA